MSTSSDNSFATKLKSTLGGVDFNKIPAIEDCKCGLKPYEYNVIIVMAQVETVTKGGIILTDQTKESQTSAVTVGRIVAMSPMAFDVFGDARPQLGDLVRCAKFGGIELEGYDGKSYRMMKDKDITAGIEKEWIDAASSKI